MSTSVIAARFLTLGANWIALQKWFAQLGALPATVAAFTERFGTFENSSAIETFVGATARAHELSRAVGGPAQLKQILLRDPDYTMGPNPPAEFYAQLVWLAGRVQNAAGSFVSTFDELPALLAPNAGSPAERARSLKEVLCGQAGLSIEGAVMRDAVNDIRRGIPPNRDAVQEVVQTFTTVDPLNDANVEIGRLESAIPRIERERNEARRKGAGWFNTGKWKEEYERLSKELQEMQTQLRLKQNFVLAMDGFYGNNNLAGAALVDADGQLATLHSTFDTAVKRLLQLCSISDVDQLSDLAWVHQALEIPAATAMWKTVAADAREFVQHAFVTP